MRHESIEISYANQKARTRRIWYGHGKSRLVTEPERGLPASEVIDAAIADFERVESDVSPKNEPHARWQPMKDSLVANLSAQLATLDRQREQLSELLRNVDCAPRA